MALVNKNATTGINATLRVLRHTRNPTADALLARAAKLPESLRCVIVDALIARPIEANLRLLLELFRQLDAREQALVGELVDSMRGVINQIISDPAEPLIADACRFALHYQLTDVLPTVIRNAARAEHPYADGLAATSLQLARVIYEQAEDYRHDRSLHDPIFERRAAVIELAAGVDSFASHERQEIVECFLLLTPVDNPVLMRVLQDPTHAAHQKVVEALTTSPSRSAWELMSRMLENRGTPLPLLELVLARSDVAYLEFIASEHPTPLTHRLLDNLGRVRRVCWLDRTGDIVGALSESCQTALLDHAFYSRAPRMQVFEFCRRVLEAGRGRGRVKACVVLSKLDVPRGEQVLRTLADDADPLVAVTACAWLFEQTHDEAARDQLTTFVDDFDAEVASVARKALRGSGFLYYLSTFDELTPDERIAAGQVALSVDPRSRELLARELQGGTVNRRLRAIAMVRALNLTCNVVGELAQLAASKDVAIRAAAVEALAGCEDPVALDAIEMASRDAHGAVRRAASLANKEPR